MTGPMQRTISPVDDSVYVERPLATEGEIEALLHRAAKAQIGWRQVPLAERIALVGAMVDAVSEKAEGLGMELCWQMGRPISQCSGEIRGFEDRARTMLRLAEPALQDLVPPGKEGFKRYIRREALGVVLLLAPWNYPYLTAVNTLVPALAAGNVVILKHSDQAPLCAERLVECARAVGMPEGVFQYVHMSHERVAQVVADPRIAFVAFTGSVAGGRAVHRAAGGHLLQVATELGGKDPAFVRADADLPFAAAELVEGAFYNSGQSCCAVERIYVHSQVYSEFVEAYVEGVKAYVLGNPLLPETTLGPVVRPRAAEAIRNQVQQAVAAGARELIPSGHFSRHGGGSCYLAPQVLDGVDHRMALMREESFGPVVGIMKVFDDKEAVRLMNESDFGLTASVWTRDTEAAERLGREVETGTWFMNRCDTLDPELAWVGVKDSGRGCSLSSVGYAQLTRPKSFHLRMPSA